MSRTLHVLALSICLCGYSSPATLAAPITGNLELWLKADAGVEEGIGDAAEAGDSVQRWLDQSGNNRVLEQNNALKRGTYVSGAINGNPALNFNGVDQWMQGTSIPAIGSNSVTIFAVVTGDSIGATEEQTIFADQGWSGLVLERGTSTNPASGVLELYSNFGGTPPASVASAGGALPTTGFGPTLVAAQKVHNTRATIYRDGSQLANVTTGDVRQPHTSGPVYIGYHAYGVEGYTSYAGDYAELMVYSRALNTAERTVVDNYLAAKYDLTVSDDRYAGDTLAQGDYDRDVIGIGAESDGTSATSSAAGLTIAEDNASLAAGEYVLAGHRVAANGTTDGDFGSQWDRTWYVDKTGAADAVLTFDFSDAGLGAPDFDPVTDIARLLFSATEGGPFAAIAAATSYSGDSFTFAVGDSLLLDGYYTLAIQSVPEPGMGTLLALGAAALAWRTRRRR